MTNEAFEAIVNDLLDRPFPPRKDFRAEFHEIIHEDEYIGYAGYIQFKPKVCHLGYLTLLVGAAKDEDDLEVIHRTELKIKIFLKLVGAALS